VERTFGRQSILCTRRPPCTFARLKSSPSNEDPTARARFAMTPSRSCPYAAKPFCENPPGAWPSSQTRLRLFSRPQRRHGPGTAAAPCLRHRRPPPRPLPSTTSFFDGRRLCPSSRATPGAPNAAATSPKGARVPAAYIHSSSRARRLRGAWVPTTTTTTTVPTTTRFLALGVGGLPVVPMVACGSSHHAEQAENREENREATSSFLL
jgi:hypothetical protein